MAPEDKIGSPKPMADDAFDSAMFGGNIKERTHKLGGQPINFL
jgi:hypothetical protein